MNTVVKHVVFNRLLFDLFYYLLKHVLKQLISIIDTMYPSSSAVLLLQFLDLDDLVEAENIDLVEDKHAASAALDGNLRMPTALLPLEEADKIGDPALLTYVAWDEKGDSTRLISARDDLKQPAIAEIDSRLFFPK